MFAREQLSYEAVKLAARAEITDESMQKAALAYYQTMKLYSHRRLCTQWGQPPAMAFCGYSQPRNKARNASSSRSRGRKVLRRRWW
jgi:hypothetical protein